MSIDNEQVKSLISSVLLDLDEETEGKIPLVPEAVDLLMMTAAHESKLGTYIKQVYGPALGIFQMEPATHTDHWIYIRDRKWLREAFENLGFIYPTYWEMEWNIKYAILMARVHYYRKPERLPNMSRSNYLEALSRYAKEHYNTSVGKATPEKYLEDYHTYCILS